MFVPCSAILRPFHESVVVSTISPWVDPKLFRTADTGAKPLADP